MSGGPLYRYGGSTITQQLAKQFLGSERSFRRKFMEARTARILEKNFTKDEILEMYINMVYFGNGAYGLKAASETYFQHEYTQMTLEESAMLVPFITAPEKYNMLKDPVAAQKRQQDLLAKMEGDRSGKAL